MRTCPANQAPSAFPGIVVAVVFAAILYHCPARGDVSSLDNALETGDIGRLLEILGPGELEVEADEGDGLAEQAARDADPDIQRALKQGDMRAILDNLTPAEPESVTPAKPEPVAIPQVMVKPVSVPPVAAPPVTARTRVVPAPPTNAGKEPEVANRRRRGLFRFFFRSADQDAATIESAPAPVEVSSPAVPPAPPPRVTVVVPEPPAPGAEPRRSYSAGLPDDVPLTRPRRAGITLAAAAEKAASPPGSLTVITVPPPATEATKATVDAVEAAPPATGGAALAAPEDRSRASAELVALLNIRRDLAQTELEPDEPVPAPEPDEEAEGNPLGTEALPDPRPAAGERLAANLTTANPSPVRALIMGPATGRSPVTPAGDPILPIRRTIDQLFQEARITTEPVSAAAGIESPATYGGWQYDGAWVNGRMDGQGVLTYPDGWKYDGEWRSGRMMGQGTLMHPDGWQYVGEWRDATMDGNGVLVFPDGWKYIGEWRGGHMHGTGRLLHPANDDFSRR